MSSSGLSPKGVPDRVDQPTCADSGPAGQSLRLEVEPYRDTVTSPSGPLANRASCVAGARASNARQRRSIQLQSTLRMSVRLLGSVIGSTSAPAVRERRAPVEPVNPSNTTVSPRTGQSQRTLVRPLVTPSVASAIPERAGELRSRAARRPPAPRSITRTVDSSSGCGTAGARLGLSNQSSNPARARAPPIQPLAH